MEEIREQHIDLREYWDILKKQRWAAITAFIVVFVTVAVYSFTAVPIFQATSRIVIEKENPNVMSIQEVMSVDATGTDYYQTQYRIIESRAVARAVISRLNLGESREFSTESGKGLFAAVKGWFTSAADGVKGAFAEMLGRDSQNTWKVGSAEKDDSPLVTEVISRISVAPVRNSRLVDVSVQAKDPVLAAKMANMLVRAYMDQNLETKLIAAKDAVQWLSERIDEERRKVEQAENELLQYKERYDIITDFSSDAEQITAQKLAQLNAEVVVAETSRVEAETRYQQAVAMEGSAELMDSIPEVLDNELIRQIKKMEVDLYSRMSELSKKYGRKHPQMVAIDSELADLKKRKAGEIKRVISALQNNYKISLAREESLKKALARQKTESIEMNKKAVQYGVLRRQAESARNMYELLVKRFKETSLTEEMKTGNIRVIDAAEIPLLPVKPRKALNLLLAACVGLMLGVAGAFFLEHMDNTIRLPDEVKTQLEIPYLGPVPVFSTNGVNGKVSENLVAFHAPKSNASESFRGIRTAILYSSADRPPQAILVTSAGSEEGKTTCAANLAVTMAQAGSRVLVVDCDMRRPRLDKFFDIKREPGLSNVLVGADVLEDVIVPTGIENLSAIACGPIPPNPSEIIGSNRMRQIIEALRKQYDRIIFDSPPITPVTDALILAQMLDGVVLVAHAGQTPKQLVKIAVDQIKSVNAHMLGAVLNGVDVKSQGRYYHYRYAYSYYGEDGLAKPSDRKRKKVRKSADRDAA